MQSENFAGSRAGVNASSSQSLLETLQGEPEDSCSLAFLRQWIPTLSSQEIQLELRTGRGILYARTESWRSSDRCLKPTPAYLAEVGEGVDY